MAGEDLYYVMFEKHQQPGSPEAADVPTAEQLTASDGEPGSPQMPDASLTTTSNEQPQQQEQHPPSSPAQQQLKKKKKLRRSQKKKLAGAAGADMSDEAALAAAYSRRKFTRVRIDEFPVASELICALMPLLRQELIATPVLRERLFQANFHTTLSKQAMITLTYHSNLDDVWQVRQRRHLLNLNSITQQRQSCGGKENRS